MSKRFRLSMIWVFFALGLCLRLGAACYHVAHFQERWPDGAYISTQNDEVNYLTISSHLARHGEYLTGGPGTMPQITRGPTYPAFLAGVFTLFGEGILAPLVIQAVLGSSLIVLVPLILGFVLRHTSPAQAAIADRTELLSAAALALSPLGILYDSVLMSESVATFLLTAGLGCYLVGSYTASLAVRQGLLVLAGAALGVLILAKPACLLMVFLFPLADLISSRARLPRERLARALLLLIVPLVVVLPWTYRNYRLTGHVIPVGLGGGPYIYLGTKPIDQYGVPEASEQDAQMIAEWLGPHTSSQRRIDIDQQFRQLARERMSADPYEFVKRIPIRVARMWFSSHADTVRNEARGIPRSVRIGAAILLGGLFCVAIAGWLLSLRWFGWTLWPLAAVVAYLTLIHAPLASGGRYVVPAWPAALCLASFAVASCCALSAHTAVAEGEVKA